MRQTELVTNSEYIPRMIELEARGAGYWTVKVLNHSAGYEISYVIPSPSSPELPGLTSTPD